MTICLVYVTAHNLDRSIDLVKVVQMTAYNFLYIGKCILVGIYSASKQICSVPKKPMTHTHYMYW